MRLLTRIPRPDPLAAGAGLDFFESGREILINPSEAGVVLALAKVQRRARRHLIWPNDAIALLRQVANGNEELAHSGLRNCPARYEYGVTSTVIQVARLGPNLIGCAIGRETVHPGQRGQPLISAHPFDSPLLWRRQAMALFWTRLDEAQREMLHQRALALALTIRQQTEGRQPQRDAIGNRRATVRTRRMLQVQALFRSHEPGYVSDFAAELQQVCAVLQQQQRQRIAWRDFQQQWPSIAARRRRQLLPIVRAGHLDREALAALCPADPKYRLRFTTWGGEGHRIQLIFPGVQLVFQVCSALLDEGPVQGDAARFSELRQILHYRASMQIHPVTPDTVGWLRVHIDDANRLVFVDEVQSDAMEDLRELERDAPELGAAALAQELEDWAQHGFSSVAHWAQSIGYRVGMHTPASAATVPGKTSSARKWQLYYGELIKRHGMQMQAVPGYPAPVMVRDPRSVSGAANDAQVMAAA